MRLSSVILLWMCINSTLGANILGLFTTPSISHQQIFQAIYMNLALKGHDVTVVVTNNLINGNISKLKEINLPHLHDIVREMDYSKFLSKDAGFLEKVCGYWSLMRQPAKKAFENEGVHEIINSNKSFDLIIVQAVHPILFALAARYKAPVVGK